MKNPMPMASVLAAVLLWPLAGQSDDLFDRNALPHDKAVLVELHQKQISMLRHAVRLCEAFSRSRHDGNICVVGLLDREIGQSGNEALKAFHWTLTSGNRYDDKRSMVDVQREIGLD